MLASRFRQSADCVGADEASGNNYWFDATSIAMPVRAGDHYNASFALTAGASAGGRLAFATLALPSGTSLGAWTHIGGNQGQEGAGELDKPAATDGFAFVSLRAITNGARGKVEVSVPGSVLATTSCHYNSNTGAASADQTLCVPIASGSNWSASWTPTSAPPLVDVFWMPIQGGGVKLGTPQPRNANTTYAAGGRFPPWRHRHHGGGAVSATARLRRPEPVRAQSDRDCAGRQSAHRMHRGASVDGQRPDMPPGAIFLPVPRGTSYQAVLDRWTAGAAGVNVVLNWTPLTAV